MGISPGLDAFRLSFELCPIIMTGGVATNLPGGALPIIAITEALNFVDGLLSGGDDLDYDNFFAHFYPIAGDTLIDQQLGKYPFANQAVAANAVIRQPLKVSLRMIVPARGVGGYGTKLATMMALQAVLASHNASGGTYIIATPSYFYSNCVMLGMTDTPQEGKQAQNAYQLDFEQPLLTLSDALQAQNSLMAQISAGTPIIGQPSWSGVSPTVGNPGSLGSIGLLPVSSGPAALSTVSPSLPLPGPGPIQ